jgi:hypothetical protein
MAEPRPGGRGFHDSEAAFRAQAREELTEFTVDALPAEFEGVGGELIAENGAGGRPVAHGTAGARAKQYALRPRR